MGIQERWRGFNPPPPETRARLDLLPRLVEEAGVLLAYVFGSFRRHEGAADIDLAPLPGDGGLGDLGEKITEILITERVDLIHLKTATPVLRFEVGSTGAVILKKSGLAKNSFELSPLREDREITHLRAVQAEMVRGRNTRWS